MSDKYHSHELARVRLAESVFPDPGRITLAQAHMFAVRYRREYDAILQRQFRGQEGAWEVLIARLAWCRAESLVVDLNVKASKALKVASDGPRHRGPGRWVA